MNSESWFTREILNIIENPETPVIVKIKSSDQLETIITFNINGNPHSFDDVPAVIRPDGTLEWYTNGLLDRCGKPAVITPYDTQIMPPINPDTITEREKLNYGKSTIDRNLQKTGKTIKYFTKGLLNNPNSKTPAVQYPDGGYEHYKMGKLHNRKGIAVKYSDKTIEYRVDGILHNPYSYAQCTSDGYKRSYIKGKLESINDQPSVISPDGTKEWHHKNLLHRRNDLPALEKSDGTKEWYKNNKLHRKGKPAKINPRGKYYYKEGKLHRRGGPAIKLKNGKKEYYKDGLLHRKNKEAFIDPSGLKKWYYMGELHSYNDKPSVIYPDGTLEYHINGQLHREVGPAVIKSNGTKEWYKYGKLHNSTGPAIVYSDGRRSKWFINGAEVYNTKLTRKILSSTDIRNIDFSSQPYLTPTKDDRRRSVLGI